MERRENDVWLTENYWLSDFDCSDGTPVPEEYLENAKKLADAIEVIKEHYGKPWNFNSVYRTEEVNKREGGKPQSFHLKCMAVDLGVEPDETQKLFDTILKLMAKKLIPSGGCKKYNTFVHYDIRGRFVTW